MNENNFEPQIPENMEVPVSQPEPVAEPQVIPVPQPEAPTEVQPGPVTAEPTFEQPAQPQYDPQQQIVQPQTDYQAPPYSQPQQPAQPYGQPQQPYGQSAQPYGQPQQPSGQFEPQPGYMQPTPPKKSPIVPIIIAVVVLALAAGAFFFFRGAAGKADFKNKPQEAFHTAMEATYENLDTVPEALPKYKVDPEKPQEIKMDFAIKESKDTYPILPAYMENLRVQLNMKTDYTNKEALVNFGLEMPIYTVKPTDIYVSPDLIAFSAPNLYSDNDFVTVNTKNFVNDWNQSSYGEYNEIPTDIDVSQAINDGFDYMLNTQKAAIDLQVKEEEFTKKVEEATTALEDKMKFNYLGMDGKDHKMEVTVSDKDLEDYLDVIATEFENYSLEQYKAMFGEIPQGFLDMIEMSSDDLIGEMMSSAEQSANVLRGIDFAGDVTIIYKFNDDTLWLSGMELKPTDVTFTIDDGYGETSEELTLAFDAQFRGKKHFSDDVVIDFTVMDSYDDKFEFQVTYVAPEDEKLVGGRFEMTFEEEGYPGKNNIYLDYSWDPANTTDTNVSVKMGVKSVSDDMIYSVVVRGKLIADETSFSFTEGRLSVMEDTSEMIALDFNISANEMAAGEIKPNTSDSVDFFDVDWEKQFMNLYSSMYA